MATGNGADYFNDTCVADLPAVDAFFTVENKPTNLIVRDCVDYPATAAPTTAAPTTMAPTTAVPTTMIPTTLAPTTAAPTTMAPTEVKDSCANLKRKKCKNNC